MVPGAGIRNSRRVNLRAIDRPKRLVDAKNDSSLLCRSAFIIESKAEYDQPALEHRCSASTQLDTPR